MSIIIILHILLSMIIGIAGIVTLARAGRVSYRRSKRWNKTRKEISDTDFIAQFRKEKSKLTILDDEVISLRDFLAERLGLDIFKNKILPSDQLNKIVDLVTINPEIQYDEISDIWDIFFDLVEKLEGIDEKRDFRIRTGMSVADIIEILHFVREDFVSDLVNPISSN